MIIVPELETLVILTPRTGSKALRDALLATYPCAFMLYRHMEADGIPVGYDRWRRVGVVREPVSRLWSLYRYLRTIGEGREPDGKGKWEPTYVAAQRASVAMPFNEWLVSNRLVFTSPYDQVDGMRYHAPFTVRHPVPENRKSQFVYLRPDLGTVVWRYDQVRGLYQLLGVDPPRINAAPPGDMPELDDSALDHLHRFHGWDFEVTA